MPTPQIGGGALTQATLAQIQQLSQAGNSGALISGQGNVLVQVSAAGISPAAAAGDYVLAAFTLPANTFDVAGRMIYALAQGTFANNANSKRLKIIFNATTAVVGTLVTGGTVIADTGAFTTAALTGFAVEGQIIKYGLPNSNTQLAMPYGVALGPTGGGIGVSTVTNLITAVESAPILVAVTGNAGTTAADILLNFFQINVFN